MVTIENKNPSTARTVGGQTTHKAGETPSINNTAKPLYCQSAAAQRQRILEYLKLSSMTTLQARGQLDIMHPAMRVLELKRRGHQIATEWTTEYSFGGSKHRIARYTLQPDGD